MRKQYPQIHKAQDKGLTGPALTRWYVAEYLRLNHIPTAGHEALLA